MVQPVRARFVVFLRLEEPDSERKDFALQSEPKLLASTLYALEDLIAKRKTEEVAPGSKPSWTRRLQQDPKLLCSKIRYARFNHLFLPSVVISILYTCCLSVLLLKFR